MTDYLTDFKESAQYKQIKHLIPDGICPFLFYNTLPYVFTLANRGWFIWIKRPKDPRERREVNNKDNFGKSGINTLYPNEVLVRCPNPRNMVVAGVGPSLRNKIKIRVLHSSGLCVNGHKAGDEVIVDTENKAEEVLELNRIFPEIVTLAFSNVSAKGNSDFCKIEAKTSIGISKIIHQCRYHSEKDKIRPELLPDGFCPHVFQAIYPYVLAKMYNADIEGTIKIKCPKQEGNLTLALEKTDRIRNSYARRVLDLLKKLCAVLYRPVDVLDYNLRIKILESEFNGCCLEKDKKYYINLRSKNFLCPASFHTVYPYILLTARNYIMKWNGETKVNLSPCPDCVGAVYSVSKK